jgi:predicted 3-demethylubiquinone-9 3-methyltransferase (glyoxalase superfamily)
VRVRYTPPRGVCAREDAVARLFPCLWFDGNAEEAANFYATLLPDSHVDKVWRSPAETPSGRRAWG